MSIHVILFFKQHSHGPFFFPNKNSTLHRAQEHGPNHCIANIINTVFTIAKTYQNVSDTMFLYIYYGNTMLFWSCAMEQP